MTEQDDFFARLRRDAAPLRHRPDEATLARIRERIHEHIRRSSAQPTVAELIASWFRPLAAAVAIVAILAGVGLATIDLPERSGVEIVIGGETYVVGD